jgi:hypothetical protein
MSLLYSNLSPLRTKYPTYAETFKKYLNNSDSLKIATGYISSDSAVDLKGIIEANHGPKLELCVGMHFFEGLSPVQLDALRSLDQSLNEQQLGKVTMVTTFPFHGKMVSFSKEDQSIGSILGSSNLTNIVEGQRQYEADYLFESGNTASEISDFISELITHSSEPLSELDIKPTIPQNNLLQDQLGVVRLVGKTKEEAIEDLSSTSFELPLKGDVSQKSGLNTYFGEGRKNQQGFVMPRPWYEVELIIPKEITTKEGYPQANSESASFEVITDDGWEFACKVSGDYSKNFRSEDDLKILGKWIKGRLENTGVLKPGERVTDETLSKYGRKSISFTKINGNNKWYLDFNNNENYNDKSSPKLS